MARWTSKKVVILPLRGEELISLAQRLARDAERHAILSASLASQADRLMVAGLRQLERRDAKAASSRLNSDKPRAPRQAAGTSHPARHAAPNTAAPRTSKCARIRTSMYLTVLLLHSWLRWLALIAGVGATFAALRQGLRRAHNQALPGAERWGLIFMIALDVQMLLGLLLYGMLSPYTAAAMNDFGAAMRDPVLRFWAVEHLTMMLAAVVLVHVGRVLARKTDDVDKKRKRLLICFGLAVLLMLLGMPWPGMASGRPLFRV